MSLIELSFEIFVTIKIDSQEWVSEWLLAEVCIFFSFVFLKAKEMARLFFCKDQ